MENLFNLKDKVAIVTGANTGLGQGICVAYAQMGAKVLGVARRSCEETASIIKEFNGTFCEYIADLSDVSCVNGIVKAAMDKFGTIDILVNNAGIIKRADALDVTVEDWDSVINVNQRTVFFLSQEFAKEIVSQNKNVIIIYICFLLSYQGGIRVPAYCASKSAIIGLTRALCNEWAAKGINVNGIAPGYMETNNTKQIRDDQNRNDAILERIPQGRWGTPRDIAVAAGFLASEASGYINGFTIAVDGGWLAR